MKWRPAFVGDKRTRRVFCLFPKFNEDTQCWHWLEFITITEKYSGYATTRGLCTYWGQIPLETEATVEPTKPPPLEPQFIKGNR